MRPEDVYSNILFISAADTKASNDRRKGILVVPPTLPGPPVDVRAILAKKRLGALVAGGARALAENRQKAGTLASPDAKAPRRRAPGSRALATIRLSGENVLTASAMSPGGWVGGVADTLVASGYPDLAALVRKRALAARIANATGPRSLVASALAAPVYADHRVVYGAVATADGGLVTVTAPTRRTP